MTDIAPGTPSREKVGPNSAASGRHANTFVPGQPDMWAFVLFETLLFGSYLAVYLFNRTHHAQAFLQAQSHLSLSIGIVNTLVLLLSSWAVARCVQAARAGAYRTALNNAYLTIVLGVAFLGLKIFEWVRLARSGFGFTNSDFYTYYYFLTAIHALHLVIGFVALGIIVHQLREPARRSREIVETAATYWHTVDYLWVIIFSLLYIVR